MHDWPALFEAVVNQFRLDQFGIHGPSHWTRVWDNVAELATTERCLTIGRYFAILHDSQRASDNEDKIHGPQAALYAHRVRHMINLSESDFSVLCRAMGEHCCAKFYTNAQSEEEQIIQTCFDADRLDLPRCGYKVAELRLHSPGARQFAPVAAYRAVNDCISTQTIVKMTGHHLSDID